MKPIQRLLVATDAWTPQVNGVVRTLETTIARLRDSGTAVEVIEPGAFSGFPMPFYPEIKLCIPEMNVIGRRVADFGPDAVHISTEGPVGVLTREFCRRRRWPFTTSYHTRFPEYLSEMFRVPASAGYHWMRWFHSASAAIMVATPSLEAELRQRRFPERFRRWSRGVDLALFHPREGCRLPYPGPILLYAGRVSKEKNIEAFLSLSMPGTKVIVGDGPIRCALEKQYPDAVFVGYKRGEDLARMYAGADAFVFPSCTDTFGLVMIEAMACGIPVAAYPVIGPIDIVTSPEVGALDADLGHAVARALKDGNADACVAHARGYTWERCTDQFYDNLVPVREQG